jgi:hypothetical protein
VIWIPAWNRIGDDAVETSEHRPPAYLRERGAPVFSREVWRQLQTLHRRLPAADDLQPIDSRETALLCQFSAPAGLLGRYPDEPRLRRDLLITVTDGELDTEADAVDECLRHCCRAAEPMKFAAVKESVVPIEFWLDLPSTPPWRALGRMREHVGLFVERKGVLVRG